MPRSPEEGHRRSAKGHGVVCLKGTAKISWLIIIFPIYPTRMVSFLLLFSHKSSGQLVRSTSLAAWGSRGLGRRWCGRSGGWRCAGPLCRRLPSFWTPTQTALYRQSESLIQIDNLTTWHSVIAVSESFASRFDDSITETGRNGRRRNRDQVRSLFCDTFVLTDITCFGLRHLCCCQTPLDSIDWCRLWVFTCQVAFFRCKISLHSSSWFCMKLILLSWAEPFFLNDLSVTSPIIMLCRSNRQPAAPEMVARCWKISGSSLWWLEPSLRWWSCWVGFKALLVSAKSHDASLIVSHHCMICMTFLQSIVQGSQNESFQREGGGVCKLWSSSFL